MAEHLKGQFAAVFLVLACVAVSSTWCITSATRLSATFDEPHYLKDGLHFWRTGSTKGLVDKGVMPLPIWVSTAPVYAWERYRGEPFDPQRDMDLILPVARAGALVFWWLLLGYGWFAGRQLAGRWGGVLAVALLAFETTLLSNAGLATTDVAAAACLLAFFIHYRLGRDGGCWKRIAIPAVWFTLAVLAKTSGLVFGVLGMLFFEIERRLGERTDFTTFRSRIVAAVQAAFDRTTRRNVLPVFWIGLVLVFVACGTQWQASPSFVKWAKQQPEGLQRDAAVWVAENLCIFSNAGNGIAYQLKRNYQKNSSFLLGETSDKPLWYFFPVSMSIKMPELLLATPLLLLLLSPRSMRNWACALALIFLLFSLNCRVQLSVRYMSPLIGFICIGLAAALVLSVQNSPEGWRRRLLRGWALATPLSMVCIAWSAWPHGFSRVNAFWGGTERGYLLTCDYDWGQGLKELDGWRRRNGVDKLDVIYFGTDPLAQTQAFNMQRLSGAPRELRDRVKGRYLAVATSALYHTFSNNPAQREILPWLRGLKPTARTTTFLIFERRELGRGTLGVAGKPAPREEAIR